ncbi:MAG TPA: hypothetical protein VFG21_07140 [Xanthomonadaceae bacterium]|nr:hypothetical protein [Xanthomonadaceae bacterium]
MSAAPARRVAMWSGPRNISTAMMRSWDNRGDCAVVDEPLYAYYLARTGLDHPLRERIVAEGDTDWRSVVAFLTGPVPGSRPLFYQKHMAHHLLPEVGRDWIAQLDNVLLIRDPDLVVASYLRARETVTADAIGLPQQAQLFDWLLETTGKAAPVIDATDFLERPEAHLRALCAHLGIAFTPRMLGWPQGPRASDGIWAPHWYQRVWHSTGFESPPLGRPQLRGLAAEVAEACQPMYRRLHARRLVVD